MVSFNVLLVDTFCLIAMYSLSRVCLIVLLSMIGYKFSAFDLWISPLFSSWTVLSSLSKVYISGLRRINVGRIV